MRLIFAVTFWVAVLAFSAPDAAAFNQSENAREKSAASPERRPARPAARREVQRRTPSNALERWRKMNPQQRQRFLEQLPPDRRRDLERRLNRLQNLSPEERRQLQRDYRRFSELSPQRQENYRDLYERLNKLPADRRPLLIREFRRLRELSPDERRERLKSDDFSERFRPNEKKLLEDVSKAMPE